ncbi:MAG: Cobalt-zinc-cadmium resistance protein CzcC precursor [Planctomycetes bacterium ADurb.Bin126]|nr:MAG: Cobalt-zinc-cadmium resistance protein CzcC precursor [Planctomycetes bacterium ADurb.Bin126]HOD82980.1 TolC family protein [Phycisphaerae bacterium]HQL75129.1 TolC family protein [Phycisphaerae bacterium]
MIIRLWALLPLAAVLAGCAAGFNEGAYQDYVRKQSFYLNQPYVSAATTAPASRPAEPELAAGSTLGDYLRYAALHSPELESAFDAWKAALQRIPQVRALPDPRFTYRHYIHEVETRVGPQKNSYELAQTFPWLGKLNLRGDVAAEEARAAFHRFEAVRLRLFFRVHKAYDEYYYLRRAIQITEQNIELLNQGEAIGRRRYTVGAGSHPDVIRAQVEQGKLADRLTTLQKMRAPIVARLNAAMNRSVGAELPWPAQMPVAVGDWTSQQLVKWAGEANPEAQALDRQIAARRKGVALARKEYFPDVTVGTNLIETGSARGAMRPSDSGQDALIAMVSVNIPIWWNKIQAGIREARWLHHKARMDKAAFLNTLSADLETALFEFQDAGRKVSLYRDTLLPKAEQALQATNAAYSTGKANFQDFLDAQRVLLEFQLSFERSLVDRAQRMAELEMLVGKPLPASHMAQ